MDKNINPKDIIELSKQIQELISNQEYDYAERIIKESIGKFIDYPHFHNYYGIIMIYKNKQEIAMKHFRASYSIDPSYKAASLNLDNYSCLNSTKKPKFN